MFNRYSEIMFPCQVASSGSLYWDVSTCGGSVHLQIGEGICAVPTADAIATGEVNCSNCILQLHTLPWFAEAISQVYSGATR